MTETNLLPCPFCGCEDIDEYEGEYGNGVYCMNCGAMMGEQVHREFHVHERVEYEQAAEAWNTRAAVTDHGFAMAVHDGKLWGKCSECKERQGYYLDAETIQRQQERIAELEREGAALFYDYAYTSDALKELIRDMWECLSAHIESAINNGGIGYDYKPEVRGCGESCTVNGEYCSMSLMEQRMCELGIEVDA